jgi:hypothetical protein
LLSFKTRSGIVRYQIKQITLIRLALPFLSLLVLGFLIPVSSCGYTECDGRDITIEPLYLEIPPILNTCPLGQVIPSSQHITPLLTTSQKVYLKSLRLISMPPDNVPLSFISGDDLYTKPYINIVPVNSSTSTAGLEICYRNEVPENTGLAMDMIPGLAELNSYVRAPFYLKFGFCARTAINTTTSVRADVTFRVCN